MTTGARITAATALAGLLAASAAVAPLPAQQQESSSEGAEERTIEVRALRAAPRAPDGGWLGARVEDLDAGEAREEGLDAPRGARILEVREGSPAAEAGLREGDVLLRLDGREVRSAVQLTRLVKETPPGREVALEVRRDGETRSLSATVGERPGPHVLRLRRGGPWDMEKQMEALEEVEGLSEEARERMRQKMMQLRKRMERAHEHVERAREHGEAEQEHLEHMRRAAPHMRMMPGMLHAGGPPRLGIEMQKLTDQLAEHFGVDDGGVLVASVREGSAAAEAGLRAGDVVVAFDGEPVTDAGELFEAVHGAEAGPVPVGVVRDGEERTVEVDLPERPEARGGPEARAPEAPSEPAAAPAPAPPEPPAAG